MATESLLRKSLSTFESAARRMAAATEQWLVSQPVHLLRVRLRQLLICSREAGERRRRRMEAAEIMERQARRWNQIEMGRGRKRREREEQRGL